MEEPRTFRQLLQLFAEDRRTNFDALSTKLLFITYRTGRFITVRRAASGRFGRILWRILLEAPHRAHLLLTMLVGCELPYSAAIGRRFRVVHGFHGIFLSVWAVIGDDVVMLHQVTVGSNNHTSNKPGAPKIGNRVFIGAGAKLIGPISIGDDARIGANAIVVVDVPANATAVSPKATVRETAGEVRVLNRDLPIQ